MPWKRILIFELIYVGIFAVFVGVVQRDDPTSAVGSVVFAVVITTLVMVALVKFGYQPAWLRSRAEMAEIRAEKIAARQALRASKGSGRASKSGQPVARVDVRDRPAPTKRTSTGPTNRQRRVRSTRKR